MSKKIIVVVLLGMMGMSAILVKIFLGINKEKILPNWKISSISRRDLSSSVLATGIIYPKVGAEVRVGSQVSGLVQDLFVKVGSRVVQGDLLAQLDPVEFQVDVDLARADLEQARAELNYARLDFERKKTLDSKAISQDEIDLAQRSFKIAEANLKRAEKNLKSAQINLNYTRIISPISGTVSSVSLRIGEAMSASLSAPVLVTVIDLKKLEIWTYVDETDIGRIQEGQRASFTVDAYPEVDFSGRVMAIYPKAEIQDNVVNYVVIVEIEDTLGKILRPEMTTSVQIYLSDQKDVLTVPNNSLHREFGKNFVYILKDNKPHKQVVRTGYRTTQYTEIVEGVSDTTKIIIGKVEEN